MNIQQFPLLQDNPLVNSLASNKISVINPATEEVIGSIPLLGKAETQQAIETAYTTQKMWSTLTAKHRASLMKNWFELILKNQAELASILTLEQGKNIKEAEAEIVYAASFIEWFAEQAKRVYGESIPGVRENQKIMVIKQPVGVVGSITPWNFPAAMITRKIAPAIAAGCSIVLKPSEETPFTALALAELARQAGIPEGVINIVMGNAQEIGLELCTNFKVRKISFTGSTLIGKKLAEQSASDIKKLSLELGGNSPFIVFADANIDKAIDGLIQCKFRNNGQACISVNRVFLAKEIKEQFIKKLLPKLEGFKIGNGMDRSLDLGPLINQKALTKVETLLHNALQNGAKIIKGGKRLGNKGFFFEPTIIDNLTDAMDLSCTEIFGPVIAMYEFETTEEVLQRANNTPYGLASYVYSQDYSKIWTFIEKLEYGMAGFNDIGISNEVAPFGGVKHSGYGREGAHQGIEEFVQTKYITLMV
jgi:succinate-semialdehyde dehydrogenase/glutarate-semialdehyde dehydrogenase